MLGEDEGMERDLGPVAVAVERAAAGNLVRGGGGLAQRFEALVPQATLGVVGGSVANRRHAGVPQGIGTPRRWGGFGG